MTRRCNPLYYHFIDLQNGKTFLVYQKGHYSPQVYPVCLSCIHHGRPLRRRRHYWVRQNALCALTRRRCWVCPSLEFLLLYQLTRSSVGLLFLWSADAIRKGSPNGLDVALGQSTSIIRIPANTHVFPVGASALLLLSSLPRIAKGPVPVVLAATSSAAGVYYGTKVYNLRSS